MLVLILVDSFAPEGLSSVVKVLRDVLPSRVCFFRLLMWPRVNFLAISLGKGIAFLQIWWKKVQILVIPTVYRNAKLLEFLSIEDQHSTIFVLEGANSRHIWSRIWSSQRYILRKMGPVNNTILKPLVAHSCMKFCQGFHNTQKRMILYGQRNDRLVLLLK